MKKLVLALVMIFMVMAGRSQSFEGLIHWNMKMNLSEEMQKKMNDPANQAKMAELKKKMDDPQFKAMMEQNPQMKAQMDAMLKMMSGGDMSSMIPSGITVKLKGSSSLATIEGGMMDKTDILYVADKDQSYNINHSAKTYMAMPKGSHSQQQKPKVTKTSETTKVLGYTCTKYIVERPEANGRTMTMNYWATTEISGIDMKMLAKQHVSKDQSFIIDDIDGVPLKVEVTTPEGSMTMECTEFKKESIPASAFELPTGYTETKI
jgi:hypothetical protein